MSDPTVLSLAIAVLGLLLAAGALAALVAQQERHNRYTAQLLAAFREERAQLINKVAAPDRVMPDGRGLPAVKSRRSPENARDYARIGMVAPPRDPDSNGG